MEQARDEPTAPHQDRALAGALATSLASALKIRPPGFDPEVLELTGNEDLLGEVPWSPMSLCHAYAKMRRFTRGGNPDSHTAGQTILSLVLEGRLPYAAPPPTGAPVVRRHIGADGQLVEADKYRDDDDAGARDDVSEASEHSDDDEDDVEAFNPFRALGIDAEGEAQYGNGDMFDGRARVGFASRRATARARRRPGSVAEERESIARETGREGVGVLVGFRPAGELEGHEDQGRGEEG